MKRILLLIFVSFVGAMSAACGGGSDAATPHSQRQTSDDEPAFDELIVFGDSSVDTGNLHLASGGFVASDPFYGGRISNGPVYVEHLAKKLGFGKSKQDDPIPAPSVSGGTNYAWAGAESGTGFSSPCFTAPGGQQTCIPTVGLQIVLFESDGRTLDGDELIVIASGYNDPSGDYAANQILGHIETLHELGGRSFLIPNMFRAGQSPSLNPASYYDEFVENFDDALQDGLDDLEETLDGITIYRVDFLALSDDVIVNPDDYGLTNVSDDACPDCSPIPAEGVEDTIVDEPNEYMWWFGHPTATFHEILGDAAADAVLSGG